jgi:type I restriction enzyme M protein
MASKTGRMAVVLPHGALFRMGIEGAIRRNILEIDLLEAVIGLGPNLFYGTGLAACILVFRKHKRPARRGQILFIDASKLFKKGRNQNTLNPEHIDQIYTWYIEYADVVGAAKVVTLDEIINNDWNLNIPRYVEPIMKKETSSVAEAIATLKIALQEAYTAEDRLKGLLQEAGYTLSNNEDEA